MLSQTEHPEIKSHIPGANLKLLNGNRAQPMNTPVEQQPKLKLEQYLGIQIKRQRQAQELKLSDVARIAGISQGMLSKIENAQVSTSLENLSRLCDVLGMPMSLAISPAAMRKKVKRSADSMASLYV